MFKIDNNQVTFGVMSHYRINTNTELGYMSQHVYFDNAQEFGATLSVKGTFRQFSSLDFLYHGKEGRTKTLLLSIAYTGKNKLSIQVEATGSQDILYTIKTSRKEIDSLIKDILDINKYWDVICPKTDDQFQLAHCRELLEKYKWIVEATFRVKSTRSFPLDMVKNTFRAEAEKLKLMAVSYASESSELNEAEEFEASETVASSFEVD